LLGETAEFNIDLYHLMYPDTDGAVSLAAPVWSYCDVGMIGAIITLAFIAVLCAFAAYISSRIERSTWIWAVYLLALMQLYDLTQIPIVGALFWSYGFVYGALTIGSTWALCQMVNRMRAAPLAPKELRGTPQARST
jgi:hypothetical protein